MKTAFIFDMDGLLLDSEPLWRKAETACFRDVGIQLTAADCELTMGMRIDEVVAFWAQRYPEKLHGTPGRELPDKIVSQMEWHIKNEAKPLPGALELIRFAVSRQIPCAIASSSYSLLVEAFAEKFDLKSKIPCRVSAQNLKYGKPHPEIFIYTAQKLNVPANCCVVFEDSINGVIAAKAAKMKCVAVPEPAQMNNSKFSIADEIQPDLSSYLKQIKSEYA